jgi:hypothetical protein
VPVPAASSRDRDLSLILEIVAQVALNALTNFVNEVAQTVVDLSVVQPRKTA